MILVTPDNKKFIVDVFFLFFKKKKKMITTEDYLHFIFMTCDINTVLTAGC